MAGEGRARAELGGAREEVGEAVLRESSEQGGERVPTLAEGHPPDRVLGELKAGSDRKPGEREVGEAEPAGSYPREQQEEQERRELGELLAHAREPDRGHRAGDLAAEEDRDREVEQRDRRRYPERPGGEEAPERRPRQGLGARDEEELEQPVLKEHEDHEPAPGLGHEDEREEKSDQRQPAPQPPGDAQAGDERGMRGGEGAPGGAQALVGVARPGSGRIHVGGLRARSARRVGALGARRSGALGVGHREVGLPRSAALAEAVLRPDRHPAPAAEAPRRGGRPVVFGVRHETPCRANATDGAAGARQSPGVACARPANLR